MRIARRMVGCLVVATCTVVSRPVCGAGPPPPPIVGWFFFNDTNFVDASGSPPLTVSNVFLVPSWEINGVEIASSEPAVLRYLETQTDGFPNILCDEGTVYFWFQPYWSSTNAGGTGPGTWARFVEMGTLTEDASIGWWSLYTDPEGCNLYFAGQTNRAEAIYLQAPIELTSNQWYQIALTYTPSNSALYINDQLLTNGSGVTYWPSETVRSNGFCVGSDGSGVAQVRGQIDYMILSDYAWNDSEVLEWYDYLSPMVSEWQGTGDSMQGDGLAEGEGFLFESGTCVTNVPVFITNVVCTFHINNGRTVTFDIQGGTNGLMYDVFGATNLVGNSITNSQWKWLDLGPTCSTYQYTNQPSGYAFYVLGTPMDSDGDSLTDAFERLVSKTAPGNEDTDGDGIPDAWELALGLNPNLNDSAQSGSRANYVYDAAGQLDSITGARGEDVSVDPEGNVLSVSQ